MRLLTIFTVMFLICAPGLAQAAAPDKMPAVLKRFQTEGATVEPLGKSHGLEGWIVTNPKGEAHYAYTTSDGAVLVGMLFAPDGTMETAQQILAYQEKKGLARGEPPPMPKAEQLYTALEKSGWVALGDKKAPPIYAVINVACDHCKEFWKDIESAVTAGKVQLRLVPYGSVEENRTGGAALLSADDPDKAWRAYMDGDAAALVAEKAAKESYEKLDGNTALTKEWRLPGPPFILYRRPSDSVVTAIAGRPENVALLLSEFTK